MEGVDLPLDDPLEGLDELVARSRLKEGAGLHADALRLGEEFHHNGLTIRCAQIGRVPRGLASAWNRRRLADETIGLVRDTAEAIREHMITDVVDLDDGPALIGQLARGEREVVQAVFRMEAALP